MSRFSDRPPLFTLAALLVLPLALLLFAQWPLRDVVQAGSRQANDLAQILFALYMAVAVSAASRAGAHLAVHRGSHTRPARWRAWALLACLAPWSAYLLWVSSGPAWASILQAEKFSETLNPGYFLIRIAVWLLALLTLIEALRPLWRLCAPRSDD